MKELLEKYIGRECVITGASGSINGTILSVNDGCVELEIKKKKFRQVLVLNINYIYKVVFNDK